MLGLTAASCPRASRLNVLHALQYEWQAMKQWKQRNLLRTTVTARNPTQRKA